MDSIAPITISVHLFCLFEENSLNARYSLLLIIIFSVLYCNMPHMSFDINLFHGNA